MRCLILSQEFPPGPGGLGTHAFEVARHLVRLGWNVVVATNQDYASDAAIEDFNGQQPFTVRRIPRNEVPFASLVDRWKIGQKEIGSFNPAIVMATGDRANYVAADLGRKHNVPWVAIEHGTLPRGLERRVKLAAYAQADALVCVSGYTWDQARKMGVCPRRLAIIPNGADADRFRLLPEEDARAARRDLNLDDRRILLTVGSVTHRKGQDTVIRALSRILEQTPDALYLCAGVKKAADEFAELAEKLGVGRSVRFLGAVSNPEIVRLMNLADVFLMTSRHTGDEFEGYGIAAVEAALCGTPSIVTGDSGLAEAIVDGVTGITVPQNDADATAAAVSRLLCDEPLRQRMGEAARIRALEEQTWATRVTHYDTLFREVIASRRRRF